MTMPQERARALRWGWYLLQSVASPDSELTPEMREVAWCCDRQPFDPRRPL
jgi:hypothetical protein